MQLYYTETVPRHIRRFDCAVYKVCSPCARLLKLTRKGGNCDALQLEAARRRASRYGR